MYQRALEGELQRTIKAFGEIDYARVHLVMPESSVFVRDKQLATASITLKLKNGIKLSPDQVRTIVALVSGSVPNLPKENVEVVDTSFNYLSQNLGDDNISAPSSAGSRYEMERQFEAGIESDLKDNLEAVFGPNKVKVSVNADLDFDSKEITSIHYDKEGIIKSQNKIVETVSDGSNLSGSPVDNNSSNTIPSGGSTSGSTHQEETTNYNVGQIEEKTVKAPGEVKRITTSVVVDGNLSDSVKASINNIVAATTGYAEERGDLITVEGIPFDDTVKKQIEADLKEMEQLKKTEERNRKLVTYIGYPAIAVAGIIFLLILISKLKSQAGKRLDVVISEPAAAVVQAVKKPPIIDDGEEDKNDVTTELKNYASKRPDQVVEIIRSWLAEDER
jgi:flagellar M-ring protein FliF